MSLKPHREELNTDISYFYRSGDVTRGGILSLDNQNASGTALDNAYNRVKYQTAGSGVVPVGLLLNDVVNKNLTRTHMNDYRDEVPLHGKVTVLRDGWVVTNNITGDPNPGDTAYLDSTTPGNVASAADSGHGGDSKYKVGRFDTAKDVDGYARLYVSLPN